MIYMLSLILVLLIVTIVAVLLLHKKVDKQFKQDVATRKWLFDSLYSINHNVLLPEEVEKIELKAAIVTSDRANPMKEFSGDHDDWHS